MNEQNTVLNIIGKVSGVLSKYIAVVILITSAVAFTHPHKFMWIPQYTALFLGTAMFGMGLTIKLEDFQIVFSRPKEVISGCILQYTIMPLAAYFLAVVMNLDTDIALGVILVGRSSRANWFQYCMPQLCLRQKLSVTGASQCR